MTFTTSMPIETPATLTEQQNALLQAATKKIAPNWPLDKLIAVNPLWSLVKQPFDTVSSELSALANIKTHMPIDTYVDWFKEGRITTTALQEAARQYGLEDKSNSLVKNLSCTPEAPNSWLNIADLADQHRPNTKMSWHDELTHQISQLCAAHYQQQSPTLREMPADQTELYAHWLDVTREDKGLNIILDETGLSHHFKALPSDKDSLFALVIKTFELDDDSLSFYAHALLLDINGWSSYLAYLDWHQEEKKESHLLSLLAIKLAWEWVIWRYLDKTDSNLQAHINHTWQQQKCGISTLIKAHDDALLTHKIWNLALELSEQQRLNQQLRAHPKPKASTNTPKVQAIFCIDVRSEIIRRALEQQSDHIQTYGFAGFFGLPIEYQAKDSQYVRPQLPGLLQAGIKVSETKVNSGHTQHEQQQARWQRWGHSAPASFSMVESMGWWYAFKMFKQTLFPKRPAHPVNDRLAKDSQWHVTQQGKPLTDTDKAALAKGILDTMNLKEFSPIVLLVGHGSHSNNNLHAAGLECGACGGQSGEVNVKVLASLLNENKVRLCLQHMGTKIPTTTTFVAALHNTTTDQITCFNYNPESNFEDKTQLTDWLKQATYAAQKERAPTLSDDRDDLTKKTNLSDQARNNAFLKRANDWSQVNPEWGLANNQTFIIAPRSFTRSMNLQGRSFLHDYDGQGDPEFTILERLLTAPMLVTHWINMQYNLSVTDNFKFGSGNKVLHNAVGGNIGVFEGNGGDLRIGLAMQSIHNGQQWMHTPVRLAVYVCAPRHALKEIVAKHPIVQQLVDNQWLYLLRWEGDTIERFYQQHWLEQKNVTDLIEE